MPKLLKLKIDSLSHDGRGVARIDGKTVFVSGALPGETVQVHIYKNHKRFDEAICEKVCENPSPERVSPQCPYFSASLSSCGGCSLQHLNSESQRQHKQTTLLEQLKHFGHVVPEIISPPLFDTSPWGYRHRARLSVCLAEKRNQIKVGFRQHINPRSLTDMNTCDILIPAIGKNIAALRALIGSLEVKRHISHIEVAAGDGSCMLIFRHLVPLPPKDREKLVDFGKTNNLWILLQSESIENLEWLFPATPQLLFYKLIQENLIFYFHPAHFTQINAGLNQKLVQRVLQSLNPQSHETILDLFCGLGNFSLPLAKRAQKVVGIEASEMMVQQAKFNAQENHLTNLAFHAADLSNTAFLKQSWAKTAYDKILLDPARTGALEIVQSIEQLSPKTIVYVSCNPSTLARDADILVNQKGYILREVGIADMFPHTSHVESIALFERKTL